MKNIEDDIRKIKEIIEDIKPKYTAFGGDIEFVDIKDKDVRIRPTGYCHRLTCYENRPGSGLTEKGQGRSYLGRDGHYYAVSLPCYKTFTILIG